MNNTLFFYGGPFSQWYRSIFTLDGVTYNTAEQYMMAQKAFLFNDEEVLNAIMRTSNPSEQKALGRQVRGFDAAKWNAIARKVVYEGNLAKFKQNSDLFNFILDSFDLELVEASPTDIIWGIGIGMQDLNRFDRSKWRGTNWLGLELMNVRATLKLPHAQEDK